MKTFKIIYTINGSEKVGMFRSVHELPITAEIVSVERINLT